MQASDDLIRILTEHSSQISLIRGRLESHVTTERLSDRLTVLRRDIKSDITELIAGRDQAIIQEIKCLEDNIVSPPSPEEIRRIALECALSEESIMTLMDKWHERLQEKQRTKESHWMTRARFWLFVLPLFASFLTFIITTQLTR